MYLRTGPSTWTRIVSLFLVDVTKCLIRNSGESFYTVPNKKGIVLVVTFG